MHLIKLSERVGAGRQDCVGAGCTVAWGVSSSPAIGEGAGACRGWRIDGDGWLAWERGGSGGRVVGQISSLQLWRRSKLIWQWQMNHLLSPNCQFSASQTPSSLSLPPLFPHHFLLECLQPPPPSSSFSPAELFLPPASPRFYTLTFLLCSPWCFLSALFSMIIFFARFLTLKWSHRMLLHHSFCILFRPFNR